MNGQIQSNTLELNDSGSLYYEVAGTGDALVLIHAGFVDSGMWDDLWQEMAQHFRVIRYDMRGYGQSSRIIETVSHMDDLTQLLKHLYVEQAYLMGCSLGGEIALDFALEYPHKVTALMMVSAVPGGFELQGEPPPHMLDMIAAVQQGDTERASELQIRIWVDGPFRQPEQVDAEVRQRASAMNRIFVANGTWGIGSAQPLDPPAIQRLHSVQIPTLIIAGALDHPEILRAANVLSATIRNAKKAIIADSAHVPNMEKPAVFNQTVISFLNTLNVERR